MGSGKISVRSSKPSGPPHPPPIGLPYTAVWVVHCTLNLPVSFLSEAGPAAMHYCHLQDSASSIMLSTSHPLTHLTPQLPDKVRASDLLKATQPGKCCVQNQLSSCRSDSGAQHLNHFSFPKLWALSQNPGLLPLAPNRHMTLGK